MQRACPHDGEALNGVRTGVEPHLACRAEWMQETCSCSRSSASKPRSIKQMDFCGPALAAMMHEVPGRCHACKPAPHNRISPCRLCRHTRWMYQSGARQKTFHKSSRYLTRLESNLVPSEKSQKSKAVKMTHKHPKRFRSLQAAQSRCPGYRVYGCFGVETQTCACLCT